MCYLIMELTNKINEYNNIRYCIGVECDYELTDDGLIKLINPRIHYREVMGIFVYVDGDVNYDVHVPSINKDIRYFKRVFDELRNNESFNRRVYNHFFVEMKGSYPEDVFEGIYYEFN